MGPGNVSLLFLSNDQETPIPRKAQTWWEEWGGEHSKWKTSHRDMTQSSDLHNNQKSVDTPHSFFKKRKDWYLFTKKVWSSRLNKCFNNVNLINIPCCAHMPCSNNQFIDNYVNGDIIIDEILISRQTAHYALCCTHHKARWPILRDSPTWYWLFPSRGNCNNTADH